MIVNYASSSLTFMIVKVRYKLKHTFYDRKLNLEGCMNVYSIGNKLWQLQVRMF
jgi:hypothetical protein